MKAIKYIEHRTLCTRDATRSTEDVEVDGILLVGDEPALRWADRHNQSGHDDVELYPAVYNGNRAWLERRRWEAGFGYSAYGTQDTIVDFAGGVTRFLERGAFNFPVGTVERSADVTGKAEDSGDEIRLVVDTSAMELGRYRGFCAALERAGVAAATDPAAIVRWEIGSRSGSWFALRVRVPDVIPHNASAGERVLAVYLPSRG